MMAAYYRGTAGIDLPSGGRIELDYDLQARVVGPSGDGWNEPRVPAHWELDGADVREVTIYHPDDNFTVLRTPQGSILYLLFQPMLDKVPEDALAAGAGLD